MQITLLIWVLEAGTNGGEITAQGTYDEIKKNKNSITGQYLSNKKQLKFQELVD